MFLRNTFYNGRNSIFPWLTFFTIGMYLVRLDRALPQTQSKMFLIGFVLYLSIFILQVLTNILPMNEDLKFYNNADYLPPFLPFVIGTVEVGLMLIATFMYISKSLIQWKLTINLAKTGQRTLTHYISHLTIGMILFTIIINR